MTVAENSLHGPYLEKKLPWFNADACLKIKSTL